MQKKFDESQFSSDPIEMYNKYGFAIVKIFDEEQCNALRKFATSWIYKLLNHWVNDKEKDFPLEKYHSWFKELNIDHNNVFQANLNFPYPTFQIFLF